MSNQSELESDNTKIKVNVKVTMEIKRTQLLLFTNRISFKFLLLFIVEIWLKPKTLTKLLKDRQTDGRTDIANDTNY